MAKTKNKNTKQITVYVSPEMSRKLAYQRFLTRESTNKLIVRFLENELADLELPEGS